jgi:hypothetical protein
MISQHADSEAYQFLLNAVQEAVVRSPNTLQIQSNPATLVATGTKDRCCAAEIRRRLLPELS